jgi:hypothetical protein
MDRTKRSSWKKFSFAFMLAGASAMVTGILASQSTLSAQGNSAQGVVSSANGMTTITAAARAAAQASAETEAYWTPALRASAISKDMAVANVGFSVAPAAAPTGVPTVAGGLPGSELTVNVAPGLGPTLRGAAATAGQLSTPTPLDGPYPGPNDTFYYGPKYTTYPISTVGKLFFHDPVGGGNFQCTATVTTGNSSILNVIWTAGHCAANGGNAYFYNNFQFCPSYNSGGVNPTRGCWNWNGSASVFTVWFNNGDLTRDEAWIRLNNTGTVWNAPVAQITGGVGFAYNFGRDQHWRHEGYPCVAPWNCVSIVETTAEHRYDVNIGGSGPFVNSWGSGQNEGSSGSGVLLFFSYGGGYLNSNVSFYFSGGPNGNEHNIEIQGPYYDTTVCTLWKAGTGYTGTC